jgi:glycosyltransferase involved in cell wall biosynthesis
MIAFCGPPLDPDYFNKFQATLKQRPWSRYLGIIPAAAMPAAMAEADLILNHSHSEGMSNALLEAVAIGRPILARNIAGNADVVKQKKLGTLYDDDTDFLDQATLFLSSTPVKPETGQNGNLFSPKKEAVALATLLKSISD